MSDLIAVTLWVAVHVLGAVPMVIAYFWGRHDGRRAATKHVDRRSWVAPRNGGYSAVGPPREPGPPPAAPGSPSR